MCLSSPHDAGVFSFPQKMCLSPVSHGVMVLSHVTNVHTCISSKAKILFLIICLNRLKLDIAYLLCKLQDSTLQMQI